MTAAAADVAPRPPYDLDRWRREIPLLATTIPMNNCSQAPQTTRTRAAAERYLDGWNARGMDWDAWMVEVDRARAAFAALINASPDDVAVMTSVSAATSAVASALDFRGPRRVVVASEAEFPTVGHVWLAQQPRGADVRWVPVRDGVVRLGDWDALIDGSTAIVSAAHGYYQNGAVQDVAEIARKAHAAGASIYVDAYQTMGTRPIDVRALGVDFLAAGNLKYLMGIPGIAFLYVRPELRERLQPTVTGWFGRVDPFAFDAKRLDWPNAARRFDTGTPPIAAAYVARAGMEMVAEVGLERIAAWTSVLSERLIAGGMARGLEVHGLAAMRAAGGGVADKSPSTAFVCHGDSHRVEEAMRARGVLASARGPVVRMAPHFYSSMADVDQALDVLAEELAREAQRR